MSHPAGGPVLDRAPLLHELVRRGWRRMARAGVTRGVHPAWFGYRWIRHDTVQGYLAQHGRSSGLHYETVHRETVASNPLPSNITSRDALPGDHGWWGYSFRDVPGRTSSETFVLTLPDALIVWYHDPARGHDFYPAIVTHDGCALDLRELRFRPLHAEVLRRAWRPARIAHATWILERVYHNHSHWLTAHLPKVLLLREREGLDEVLLPRQRTSGIDGSLRRLGLAPEAFPAFAFDRPLRVEQLTILGTDRFQPELLRQVPRAYGVPARARAGRRIFISRAKAARRRLVNEEEVWPILGRAGFERVCMEDLTFDEQVDLMHDTAVLCAPHGAGLTNMMFCPPGCHVVEFADLSFPNPNFYALASAMRHHYWLLPARPLGDCHPLEKDLLVEPTALSECLSGLPSS